MKYAVGLLIASDVVLVSRRTSDVLPVSLLFASRAQDVILPEFCKPH